MKKINDVSTDASHCLRNLVKKCQWQTWYKRLANYLKNRGRQSSGLVIGVLYQGVLFNIYNISTGYMRHSPFKEPLHEGKHYFYVPNKLPWTLSNFGGYFFSTPELIRTPPPLSLFFLNQGNTGRFFKFVVSSLGFFNFNY